MMPIPSLWVNNVVAVALAHGLRKIDDRSGATLGLVLYARFQGPHCFYLRPNSLGLGLCQEG